MKTPFFLFLTTLVFAGCGTTQTQDSTPILDNTPPFEVMLATASPWAAGVRGGGSGIIIEIQLNQNYDALQHVYYQGQKAPVDYKKTDAQKKLYRAYINTPANTPKELVLHKDPNKEFGNKPPTFGLKKDQLAIIYTKKKKSYYTIVPNVQRKPSVNYM